MREVAFNTQQRLVHPNRLRPIQPALLPPKPALLLLAPHAYNDIARVPVGALVRLSLVHDLMSLRRAARDVERVVLRVVHDLVPAAVRARLRDHRPSPAALVTRGLHLGEHPREDLLPYDFHAGAVAAGAGVHVGGGRGARAATVVAQDALLDHELRYQADKAKVQGEFRSVRTSILAPVYLGKHDVSIPV